MQTALSHGLIESHIRNAHRIRSEAVFGGLGMLARNIRAGIMAGATVGSLAALILIG